MARLPSGAVFSAQGWDLLALAGSGKPGFTLAAVLAA
jgi:hypothetical protein